VSGYPPLKYEALRLAALQGVDLAWSSHFANLWTYVVQDVIRGVVLNMHLPVARSAGGFLQPGASLVVLLSALRSPFPARRLDWVPGGRRDRVCPVSGGRRSS
jgi:hypothetical protein